MIIFWNSIQIFIGNVSHCRVLSFWYILVKILVVFLTNIVIQFVILGGNTPRSFSHGPTLVSLSIQKIIFKNHCGVTTVSLPTTVDECKVHGPFYWMVFKASPFIVSFRRSSRESVRPNLSSVGVALSHIQTEDWGLIVLIIIITYYISVYIRWCKHLDVG